MDFFFQKILGIYPEEYKKSLLFALLAFISSYGVSCADILSTSFFIEKIGSDLLPIAFMIKASCMICFSSLFLYLLRKKTPPSQTLKYVLVSASIVYFLATIISVFSLSKYFWFVLHILSYLFEASLIACLWTFIDKYHVMTDAKRMYGFYNASYYSGAVIAGAMINIFIKNYGSTIFLFSMSLALLISAFVLKRIYSSLKNYYCKHSSIENEYTKIITPLKNLFKSPYTILLISMSFIIQLLITTTTYSYMDSFSRIFTASSSTSAISESILAEFLGKWNSIISFGNIIVGMFFYRRCIKKIGLSNTILIPPLCFVFLYFNWLFFDTLVLAILGLVMVNGILYTVEDNNFNLLINAAPQNYQGSLRIINDSFFEAFGMLFSSILLMFLSSNLSSLYLGIILSIGFLTISFKIRRNYKKEDKRNAIIKFNEPIYNKDEALERKAPS